MAFGRVREFGHVLVLNAKKRNVAFLQKRMVECNPNLESTSWIERQTGSHQLHSKWTQCRHELLRPFFPRRRSIQQRYMKTEHGVSRRVAEMLHPRRLDRVFVKAVRKAVSASGRNHNTKSPQVD